MDVDALRSPTRPMRDGAALEIAEKVLDGRNLNELKTLERGERNSLLGLLLSASLSIRQIERLTGISRGIIQSIKPDKSSTPDKPSDDLSGGEECRETVKVLRS
jgi:hypothetical protein